MSEKKITFDDVVNEGWQLVYAAIKQRDKHGLSPEVIRVARALCYSHGDVPEDLVQMGTRVPVRFGLPGTPIHQGATICLAWRAYVDMAQSAIANLEAHRQEEDDRLKQQEKSYDNDFSGMNDGGIKGEYRILDILDRLERGKKFRAEAGTETYIKMIEEDRNELLRRLIASKLVPPYTVPPRRSLQ